MPIDLTALAARGVKPEHVVAALEKKVARLKSAKAATTADPRLPHQQAPENWRRYWLFMAGRGAGKTWVGARECIEELRRLGPKARVIILAVSHEDARKTCIEGDSGLYTWYRDEFVSYNKSTLELRHKDGGIAQAFGADGKSEMRGQQGTFLWIDEIPLIKREVVDNAILGNRLGGRPRGIFTTTPRPTALMRGLLKDPQVVVSRATTVDNTTLTGDVIESFYERFRGTRLERQELQGELIKDVAGALWAYDTIAANRVSAEAVPHRAEIVKTLVSVDHAVKPGDRSDYTGIVVACIARNLQVYILHSERMKKEPNDVVHRVVALCDLFETKVVLLEDNQGGRWISSAFRSVDPTLAIVSKAAKASKVERAQPVSIWYIQGQVHHVGVFETLENEMIAFTGGADSMHEHDDEIDAMVHAVVELRGSRGGSAGTVITTTLGSDRRY